MKKYKKVILTILIILILCFLASLYLQTKGNPFVKFKTKKLASAYLLEKYNNYDFEISDINYNFKDGIYYAHIISESSIDSHFSIGFNKHGDLINDDYDNYVASKFNTFLRIDEEYRKLVEEIFKDTKFESDDNYLYGTIITKEGFMEYEDYFEDVNCLVKSDLILDEEYDITKLADEYGHINVSYKIEPTLENAANIMKDIKEIVDENNLNVKYVSLSLMGNNTLDMYLYFPYELIESDEFMIKLEETKDNTEAYFSSITK